MRSFPSLKMWLVAWAWQVATLSFTFGQQTYQISANIKGLADQPVRIQYSREGTLLTDTISIRQGQFKHTMTATDGHIATLLLNSSLQLVFWLDSSHITITGSVKPTLQLNCIGSTENGLLNVYRNTIVQPYTHKKQGRSSEQADLITLQEEKATRQFIEQHPSSLTAAYLLYWQSIYDTTQFEELGRLLAKLPSAIQGSYWAKKAVTRMYNVRNRPRIGQIIPSFDIKDVTGRQLTSDSFRGKYLLLDFWATWCVPCIEGIPELKAINAKYSDRLSILSIAWERPDKRDKWLNLITKYDMSWPQAVDLRGSQEGLTELYNVKEFPTLMVIDMNGRFIGRIKYGQPMEEQLQQLLVK